MDPFNYIKAIKLIKNLTKIINHWIQFTKKRKRQRLGLKLLKPVSLHLGNPRFVNFKV